MNAAVSLLAALDPSVAAGVLAWEEARAGALRRMVGQLLRGHSSAASADDALAVLRVLTSFETFDALAGPPRTAEEAATLLIRTAHAVVGPQR